MPSRHGDTDDDHHRQGVHTGAETLNPASLVHCCYRSLWDSATSSSFPKRKSFSSLLLLLLFRRPRRTDRGGGRARAGPHRLRERALQPSHHFRRAVAAAAVPAAVAVDHQATSSERDLNWSCVRERPRAAAFPAPARRNLRWYWCCSLSGKYLDAQYEEEDGPCYPWGRALPLVVPPNNHPERQ
jgi:hypothetical protein